MRYQVEYDPESSYVYGKFIKIYDVGTQQWNMGFVLENVSTNKKYAITFVTGEKVYLIAVEPGIYTMIETIILYGQREQERTDIRSENISFEVQKGHAIYLGDWRGVIEKDRYSSMQWESIEDNFKDTTAEFHTHYTAFTNVQVGSIFK